jgi:phosphoadenosine phosphosulfate reductase
MNGKDKAEFLNNELQEMSIVEKLNYLSRVYKGRIVFTTSFGYEDQVITDFIFGNDFPVEVVTLDTGRLFEETYKVYRSTLEKYKKPVKVFFPPTDKVEKLLNEKGPFSFYESLENRKECCFIRKVIPLKRALEGHEIWITGLRASQSENRSDMKEFEWDEGNKSSNLIPFNMGPRRCGGVCKRKQCSI